MRLRTCTVQNFGSYQNLHIDFSNIGLGLIYGPTGSGKSTIMDIACWTLFGITAKDGAVDEVRSWQSPGEPTKGILEVELSDGTINVTRVRGNPKQNDLYWTESTAPDVEKRGKDIAETQKLLNARLGLIADTYIAASYFHEFSEAGKMFTASAKDRRALFERLARLELPKRLAEGASERRKTVKGELANVEKERDKAQGRLDQLRDSLDSSSTRLDAFESEKSARIQLMEAKFKGFEIEKASKIQALQTKSDRWEEEKAKRLADIVEKVEAADKKIEEIAATSNCKRCKSLALDKKNDLLDILAEADASHNPFTDQIEAAKALENHYSAQIEAEKAKVNPFISQAQEMKAKCVELESKLSDFQGKCSQLEYKIAQLTKLYDLSFNLRGELLRKAVREIETQTNYYLETYFDAELRITFNLDGDDLEVGIQKSGYECVYRQLSKGQRQLLKLSFAVSVMKAAANSAGVHFQNLFFDEALDGLDPEMKLKSFGLFEELSTDHETVLVIEHSSEFKELFSRRFRVTMQGDVSELSLEDPEA